MLQEAAEMLLDEAYSQILDKAEVAPYGPGEFVDMQPSPLTFQAQGSPRAQGRAGRLPGDP